jgi:hypothetical protein
VGGGEFDWGTLYTYLDISQQNPSVQLIYANKKWKKYLYFTGHGGHARNPQHLGE